MSEEKQKKTSANPGRRRRRKSKTRSQREKDRIVRESFEVGIDIANAVWDILDLWR